jgi:hypothetical protein
MAVRPPGSGSYGLPANERANGNLAKSVNRGSADAKAATSAQVAELEKRSVVLIIRRSWVRSPPAPLFDFSLLTWKY